MNERAIEFWACIEYEIDEFESVRIVWIAL